METKTIKGIDEDTWRKFKVLAAKQRVPMGKLLNSMVDAYEKSAEDTWSRILGAGKILSDKEADEIEELTRKTRKESWSRNAPRS